MSGKSTDAKWSGGYTEAEMQALAFRRRMKEEAANPTLKREAKKKKKKHKKKHKKTKVDEFGRDVPSKRQRSSSVSSTSSVSSIESLPPEDPFRPDMDENRHHARFGRSPAS
ncbi:hypothetical protein, variant [Saprolegnia diclina VS20]|uniref:Uncharacterized protein n=1 Tax=Saprolegnia diclina (strain VS20) TaxID=1156394 RepID=T0QRT7_SAPDV|nr:hypothetical protein, variant [Saprolegnia diclina VS20]EQC40854.1 hypothetical protein, variant [Saprolegnia diclina VS20]|eukprot:XP_008605698.1 hypothetical protein, variant [Saprolegnia diclina VS20]